MATNDVKKFEATEVKLMTKALQSLRASLLRAKTKEAADEVMTEIYDKRIREVDALMGRVTNKELF